MATTDNDDAVAAIARAAALRLANHVDDPRLPVEVERWLQQPAPPDQYIDPISISSLVVSIASLALAVYQELRQHADQPSTEVIKRRVRVKAIATPDVPALAPAQRDHVITVMVEETLRHMSSEAHLSPGDRLDQRQASPSDRNDA